jgi:hypothetical protein
MALNPASLGADLGAVFAAMPPTPQECAEKIAKAYMAYAKAANFGASLPVIPSVNESAMAATLAAGLVSPGLPPIAAAAFSVAVTVFWIAVPVVGAMVGVTVGCPGAASLTGSIPVVLLNLANTPETCGLGIAMALHSATMSVTANVAPPPGTVLPIA